MAKMHVIIQNRCSTSDEGVIKIDLMILFWITK